MLLRVKKFILKMKIRFASNCYIIAGAGNSCYPGWISTEKEEFDITKEEDYRYLFSKKKIQKMLLEHVVEHLEYNEFLKFLMIVRNYLEKKATIRIAVPDAYHPSSYVRELVGVNGSEPGADDHKYFYSIDDFIKIANIYHFKLEPLEYFDSSGVFHKKDFNFDNGFIKRCSINYKGRFTDNPEEYKKLIETTPEHLREQFIKYGISYTSLLVDFIYE